jgi:putative DNA-invertase from lambdoid prophage Rac
MAAGHRRYVTMRPPGVDQSAVGVPGRKPSFTRQQFETVRAMLGQQAVGVAHIAKAASLSRQTVYRINGDPVGSEAALATRGL